MHKYFIIHTFRIHWTHRSRILQCQAGTSKLSFTNFSKENTCELSILCIVESRFLIFFFHRGDFMHTQIRRQVKAPPILEQQRLFFFSLSSYILRDSTCCINDDLSDRTIFATPFALFFSVVAIFLYILVVTSTTHSLRFTTNNHRIQILHLRLKTILIVRFIKNELYLLWC